MNEIREYCPKCKEERVIIIVRVKPKDNVMNGRCKTCYAKVDLKLSNK